MLRFGRWALLLDRATLLAAGLVALACALPLIGAPAYLPPILAVGIAGIVCSGLIRVALYRRARGREVTVIDLAGEPLRETQRLALRLVMVGVIVATAGTIVRAQLRAPLATVGIAQVDAALRSPWIAMTMTDLFAGFCVTSMWLVYRERRLWLAAFLIANLWFWGNIVLALYLLALSFRASLSARSLLLRPPADDRPFSLTVLQ